MNAKFAIVGAVSILFSSAFAGAQEEGRGYFDQRVRAPSRAFELTASTGYTQGLGLLRGGGTSAVTDVANAGIGFGASFGYRFVPALSLAATGEFQEFDGARGNQARAFAAGVEADFHFMPYRRVDPWLAIGTGYRGFWDVDSRPGTTVFMHGFRLARASLGLDIRTTPGVSVGPMVGADVNTLLWEKASGVSQVAISDVRLSTFVFAGIQGRFDVGGTLKSEEEAPPRLGGL